MAKAANGWKTCSRGHKWRGPGGCPVCWPGQAERAKAKGGRRTQAARP